jgi:hypothetical protein
MLVILELGGGNMLMHKILKVAVKHINSMIREIRAVIKKDAEEEKDPEIINDSRFL